MIRRPLEQYGIFAILLLECLVLSLTTESFLTGTNLGNVLRQHAFTAVLAAGMTFVIVSGAIDLSVGSIVGLAGVVCADLTVRGYGVGFGVAAGIMSGVI